MKTLVVANQKGGVGKTSTLVHLAFHAYETGLKVAVIDLDTQANASYTLKAYATGKESSALFRGVAFEIEGVDQTPFMALINADAGLADMEKKPLPEAAQGFRSGIQALARQGFDLCLIDTAPSLGNAMAAALLSADAVLSPIELEAYSMQGIEKMVTAIANIRRANPGLEFLGMVPSKVDSRNARHGRHLQELEAAYPQLMITLRVGLRSSIADALATGVPVWKIRKTAARIAAKEVRALAEHVLTRMELAQ